VVVATGIVGWVLGIGHGQTKPQRVATASSGSESEMEPNSQPAGPRELRRALVHSLDDFENVLRRNDRLLASREPLAVSVRTRPATPN